MRLVQEGQLFQLSFMPRFFPVNCYLVEEEDHLTLIDAALPYCAKAITRTASQIGKPIAHIVLTHAHTDHIGVLDTLHSLLPEARIYISARDARLLAGDRSLDPGETQMPIRGSVPNLVRTVPDEKLVDGDRVGSLLVIAAPGHTPGSIALQDTRTQALIAGDAFQTRGGIAVSGHLQAWFPFPAMATWCRETALASARKLAGCQPSLLAVGHGKMLTDPIASMHQAIAAAEAAYGHGLDGKGRT